VSPAGTWSGRSTPCDRNPGSAQAVTPGARNQKSWHNETFKATGWRFRNRGTSYDERAPDRGSLPALTIACRMELAASSWVMS
jgi:hypothetical protein